MTNSNNQKLSGKIPPQNIEAEESLLGCLLIDKDAIIKVADTLFEDDFYKTANGLVYGTIKELYSRQEPVDVLTLANRLDEKKQLVNCGGRTYLAKLTNAVATSANVANYSKIIQRKSTLRRLQTVASEIVDLSFQEDEDVEKILDLTEQKVFSVSRKYMNSSFANIDSLLTEAFDRIDELHKQSGKLRGVPTGLKELDNLLAGLQKSDLVILAARPSVGKTALAMDIARNVAVKAKVGVGVFSLEMSKEQMVDRMLCAQANVNLWKMRTGNLSDKDSNNDFSKIGKAMGELAESPIYIDDTPNSSVMAIRAKSRRLQMEKGLGLIIIDYLQLMEGKGKYGENRVQEIAEISRGLKGIARELNIPVLALAQLSRAVELTSPAIPKLSHLRDSGSIEQDADVVMFIYRKAVDKNFREEDLSEEEKTRAEIHIAKHRNGPTGRVDLFFDKTTVSFKNLDKKHSEEPPTGPTGPPEF